MLRSLNTLQTLLYWFLQHTDDWGRYGSKLQKGNGRLERPKLKVPLLDSQSKMLAYIYSKLLKCVVALSQHFLYSVFSFPALLCFFFLPSSLFFPTLCHCLIFFALFCPVYLLFLIIFCCLVLSRWVLCPNLLQPRLLLVLLGLY